MGDGRRSKFPREIRKGNHVKSESYYLLLVKLNPIPRTPSPLSTLHARSPRSATAYTMASSSAYEDVRAAIAEKGSDARVEVNQRALIDKVSDLRETFLFVFTIVLKNDTQHSSLHYIIL